MKLKIRVKGSEIKIVKDELVVTDALHAYEIFFEFDKAWNDLDAKTAVFYQPSVNRNNPTYRVIDESNRILIPDNCLVKDDYLYIGVFGFRSDRPPHPPVPPCDTEDGEGCPPPPPHHRRGMRRVPTIYCYTYVKTGCYKVEQCPKPDPSVYEQIYAIALNAFHTAMSVRKDANEGKFDGYSPEITVKTQTEDTYILHITTRDEEFDTPNLKGDKGDEGGDKHYLFEQSVASATWIIEHNLNKYPSVTVVDSGNSKVVGDVYYIDKNSLRLEFSAEFAGKAYLN